MQQAERKNFTSVRLLPTATAANGQLARYIDATKSWQPVFPPGGGDMMKSVYDPQGVGVLIYRADMKTDDLVMGDA